MPSRPATTMRCSTSTWIRVELRRAHIARLQRRPDVVVLGASHWQEAHADLLPGRRFYNAHVHRDYHEDLLAVVEMLLRHDRLPKTLLMSIRDMTFLPAEQRTDTLWLTALPDANAMKARLGIARAVARDPPAQALARPALALGRCWTTAGAGSSPPRGQARSRRARCRPWTCSRPTARSAGRDGHRDQFTPERTSAEVEAAIAQRQNLTLRDRPGRRRPRSIACWRCCASAACASC